MAVWQVLAVLFVAAMLAGVYREARREAAPTHVCARCGTVSGGKRKLRGSIWITLVLACFFLVPGILYALWRSSTAHRICPSCGAAELVPVDTPVGRRLAR